MQRVVRSSTSMRKHHINFSEFEREVLILRCLEGALPKVLDCFIGPDYFQIKMERCDPIVYCADGVQAEKLIHQIRPALHLLHTTHRAAHLSISPHSIGRTTDGTLRLLNVSTLRMLGDVVHVHPEMHGGYVAADITLGGAVVEERFDWFSVAATAAWLESGTIPFKSPADPRYQRLRAIAGHGPCLSSLALFMGLPDLPPRPFLFLLLLGVSRGDVLSF